MTRERRMAGEAWAVFNALRNLGFAPEQIFVETAPDVMGVCLRLTGDVNEERAWAHKIGDVHGPEDAELVGGAFTAFINDLQADRIPPRELNAIYDASWPRRNPLAFVTSLCAAGVPPPGHKHTVTA